MLVFFGEAHFCHSFVAIPPNVEKALRFVQALENLTMSDIRFRRSSYNKKGEGVGGLPPDQNNLDCVPRFQNNLVPYERAPRLAGPEPKHARAPTRRLPMAGRNQWIFLSIPPIARASRATRRRNGPSATQRARWPTFWRLVACKTKRGIDRDIH